MDSPVVAALILVLAGTLGFHVSMLGRYWQFAVQRLWIGLYFWLPGLVVSSALYVYRDHRVTLAGAGWSAAFGIAYLWKSPSASRTKPEGYVEARGAAYSWSGRLKLAGYVHLASSAVVLVTYGVSLLLD